MVRTDPYSPDANRYECPTCGSRTASSSSRPTCSDCEVEMRNVALPRE